MYTEVTIDDLVCSAEVMEDGDNRFYCNDMSVVKSGENMDHVLNDYEYRIIIKASLVSEYMRNINA